MVKLIVASLFSVGARLRCGAVLYLLLALTFSSHTIIWLLMSVMHTRLSSASLVVKVWMVPVRGAVIVKVYSDAANGQTSECSDVRRVPEGQGVSHVQSTSVIWRFLVWLNQRIKQTHSGFSSSASYTVASCKPLVPRKKVLLKGDSCRRKGEREREKGRGERGRMEVGRERVREREERREVESEG